MAPPAGAIIALNKDVSLQTGRPFCKIYPNPSSGSFKLDLTGVEISGKTRVEIFSMQGEKVLSAEIEGKRSHEFSLADRPAGIYLIHVLGWNYYSTGKVMLYH